MNHWFTSDTHYWHKNIIKYSNRPFSSVEEMNEAMIANYNAVVRPGDMVYHLGDFAFARDDQMDEILSRLPGQKYLIWGNHDKGLKSNRDLVKKHFIWARDMQEIRIGDQKIVLCHYSMRVWNQSHYGSYQLYGHSHGSLYDDPHMLSMDVGVDPNKFAPISYDQVVAHMKTKTWEPIDHHTRSGKPVKIGLGEED